MKKLTTYITIATLVSFMTLMCVGVSFAGSNGNDKHLSEDASKEMNPGWLNADLYKTYKIKEVKEGEKGARAGKEAEYLEQELGQSLAENTTTKVQPDLKKKTSSGNASDQTTTAGTAIIDEDDSFIPDIGNGTDQRDEDGELVSETGKRMVSEMIDGRRCYYLGFTNVGVSSIQDAVNLSRDSGIIIAKSGSYAGDVTMSGQIRLYGGYGENGTRDVWGSPTEILGKITITDEEIKTLNGLKLNDISGVCPPKPAGSTWGNVTIGGSIFAGLADFSAGNYVTIQSCRFLSGSSLVGHGKVTSSDFYDADITALHPTIDESTITISGSNFYGDADFDGTICDPNDYPYDQEIVAYNNFFENSEQAIGGTVDGPAIGASIPYTYSPVTLFTEKVTDSVISSTDSELDSPMFYSSRDYSKIKSYLGLPSGYLSSTNYINPSTISPVFKSLLENKDSAMGDGGVIDPNLIEKMMVNALEQSVLFLSDVELSVQDMEIAMILANILQNPTEDQKLIIDVMESIMNEARKLKEETGDEELKEASDDFTEMVATALLAQAIPDLLKEDDMSNIKSIFKEMDVEKGQILSEYEDSVKAYHSSLVKELAANIATLQIKDLLSKDLTEKELRELPTQRIDEIINKIRNVKDKTITEEQILKHEAKYREEHLTPAKQIFEKNMKTLLCGFTRKLFSVLDGAGLVKENTIEGKPVLNIDLSVR